MVYLIDMDGVIVNFNRGFSEKWKSQYPDKIFLPPEKRKVYELEKPYSPECQELILKLIGQEGFFRSLKPNPGSLDALKEMREIGLEPFICTSPWESSKYCIPEKLEWIENYLGKEWPRRTIITQDKTLVRGEILIDDKPEIIGVEKPAWKHILYDHPYNRHIKNKRRLTWDNWKEVLNLA